MYHFYCKNICIIIPKNSGRCLEHTLTKKVLLFSTRTTICMFSASKFCPMHIEWFIIFLFSPFYLFLFLVFFLMSCPCTATLLSDFNFLNASTFVQFFFFFLWLYCRVLFVPFRNSDKETDLLWYWQGVKQETLITFPFLFIHLLKEWLWALASAHCGIIYTSLQTQNVKQSGRNKNSSPKTTEGSGGVWPTCELINLMQTSWCLARKVYI